MSLNKSFYFQYAMYLATLLKFIANLVITTNTLSKATISSFETKCTPPAVWAIENVKKRTSIIVIKITFPQWMKAKDLAELQRNWSDRWRESSNLLPLVNARWCSNVASLRNFFRSWKEFVCDTFAAVELVVLETRETKSHSNGDEKESTWKLLDERRFSGERAAWKGSILSNK